MQGVMQRVSVQTQKVKASVACGMCHWQMEVITASGGKPWPPLFKTQVVRHLNQPLAKLYSTPQGRTSRDIL